MPKTISESVTWNEARGNAILVNGEDPESDGDVILSVTNTRGAAPRNVRVLAALHGDVIVSAYGKRPVRPELRKAIDALMAELDREVDDEADAIAAATGAKAEVSSAPSPAVRVAPDA